MDNDDTNAASKADRVETAVRFERWHMEEAAGRQRLAALKLACRMATSPDPDGVVSAAEKFHEFLSKRS